MCAGERVATLLVISENVLGSCSFHLPSGIHVASYPGVSGGRVSRGTRLAFMLHMLYGEDNNPYPG